MRAGFAHRLGEVLAAQSLWPRADETQPAEVLEAESHSGEHGPDRGVERALRPGQGQSGLEVRRTPGRTLISSTHTAETLMVRPSSPREARSAAESSSARMFAKVSASSRSASSPVMRNLC